MFGPALVLDSTLNTQRVAFRTRSGRNALKWISNRALSFSEIVLDGGVWDEDLVTLCLEALRTRPVTPLRVAIAQSEPAFQRLLQSMGFSVMAASASSFVDPRAGGGESQPGFAAPLSLLEEGDYLGIPVMDFLGVERSPSDVYFKSPAGKWVLLVRAGEPEIKDRATNYWQKGLQYLYIRRDGHEARIAELQALGARFARDQAIPGTFRTAHVIRGVSRRMEQLKRIEDVTASTWKSIAEAVEDLDSAWAQGPWSNPEKALSHAILVDHSTSVMVLALMLGQELELESRQSMTRLGLAAAFHDIGLLGMPIRPGQIFDERDPSRWPPEAKVFFERHAERGAEWVLHQLRADSMVGQAIALHHWRRNQPGAFGLGHGVPRLVEVIGLAEELDFEIRRPDFQFSPGWLERFRQRVSDQFSVPVLDSLPRALQKAVSMNEIEIDFGEQGA